MDKQIKVKYTDNTDYRDEMFFSDMESAKKYIEEELDNTKEYFDGRDYDYSDYPYGNGGMMTKIWDNYSDEWAMWTVEKIR